MTSFSPRSSDFFLPGSESGNSIQQQIYQQSWILPRYVWDGCKAFPAPHACITASCCSHSSTLHTRSMAFLRAGMNPSLMNIFKEGIGFAEVPTFLKNLFHYKKLQESFWDPQARLLLQVMQLTFLKVYNDYNNLSKVLRTVPIQHKNKMLESCRVSCPEILQPGLHLWTAEEVLLSLRQQLKCEKWDMKSNYPELAGPIALVMKLSCLLNIHPPNWINSSDLTFKLLVQQ